MTEAKKALVERLFAEQGGALRAFLLRRTRAHPEAADLAQEVYVRMLRIPDMGAIRNPEAYLYTVASNLAKEHAQQERRDRAAVDVDASVGDSAKACAMNSSALRTAARSGGPPRQTRTASGGGPSVANASLATTPMPVERMWPTKAERVQGAGSVTHRDIPPRGRVKLASDGKAISGIWNTGAPLPLNMVRATPATAWIPDAQPSSKPMSADAAPRGTNRRNTT